MKIKKVLNANTILAEDEEHQEYVFLEKGLVMEEKSANR